MKKTYILLFALSFATLGFSQTIATIDRLNGPGPTLTDNVAGVSAIGLTRGAGINQVEATGASTFASNTYTIGGNLADAQANDDYIEWSLSANTDFEIILNDIDIRLRRNDNGPDNVQLFYSLDGFTTPGPGIAISGPQTLPASVGTNFNLATLTGGPLGISSTVSGTITFRLYAWGALGTNGIFRVVRNSSWDISPAVLTPGIRLIGSLIDPEGVSFDSDIIASSTLGFPAEENIDYINSSVTSGLTLSNSTFLGEFTIRDGGDVAPDTDTNPTILSEITFAIANSENIATLAIFEPSFPIVPLAEVTNVTALTTFSGLNISADDDGVQQFFITATFKSTVTDNDQIQLTINSATTPATGSSLFLEANAGGAFTSITDDINRIEVSVSQFQFNQQPTDGNELEVMTPFPTLFAVDANLNQDLDAAITGIGITTIPGSSIVAETYDMINGEAIINNVVFIETEIGVSLVASATGLSGASNTFDINGPLLNIAEQNFDTETGWSYTSDTAFRNTDSDPVGDWGGPVGYFGEIALAEASPIDNTLFSNDIFGENNLNDTDNPFAILTFADIDVSEFTNLKIEFDWQVAGYAGNENDIEYRLVLNGSISGTGGWQFVFDGVGGSEINDARGRVKIAIPDGNSTVGLLVRLRNDRTDGYSGFDNFRLVSEFSGLIYTNAGGWKDNIEPDATTGSQDALVIDGTYTVGNDVQINNLIISSGAKTVIDFGKSITTNANVFNSGDLELISISNNYSSLIVNGSIQNEVTYDRHVNEFGDIGGTGATTGGNDFISAPVTNASQTFGALRAANPDIIPSGLIGGVTSYFFGPFDNDLNQYIIYNGSDDNSVIASGIGYRTGTDTAFGSNLLFVGNVETGTKTVPITRGTASIFNLIGNPYPSYISLFDFLAENNDEFAGSSGGVYAYSGDFTEGFIVYNQAYVEGNLDAVIAPGQGFLVSSTSGGGTITFLPTMRSIGTSDDYVPGRPGAQNLAHLKLQLNNGSSLYNTDLYFNDNASLGMDPGYDSALFENITPSFAMYSHLVENNSGRDMAVQSVSYSDLDNVTIPLGINMVQGVQATEATVSILESNIPEGITVILEDNVSNTFTDLQAGDYIFTPTTTLSETGRFYIHMSREALGTVDNILNGLEIYTTPNLKQIVVKGLVEAKTTFQLYDIQGRVVNTQLLNANDTKHTIDVSSLVAGIYVVQLKNIAGNRTQKVILR